LPPFARIRALAGSLPSSFWVLWWGVLLNRAASFVVGFLALFLVQERGYGVAAAGRMVALYGVGGVLAAVVGGTMADRLGRRFTMLVGLALSALAVGALAVARGPALLAGLTFLAGAAGQMYPPALNAAVADVVPFADRPRAFGLVYWAANVGFGLGFAIAAAVGPHSLPALFVLDAVTTAGFLALVAWRFSETRPTAIEHHPVVRGLWRVLGDRPFVTFLGLHLVILLVFTQWALLLGVDTAAHGVGRGGYALLLCLNCVGAIVLQPLLGPWIARRDPTRALVASALFFGIGYGLNAFATTLPLYAVGVLLWTVGEVLCLPVASALAAALAPPALRGRYQGVYALVFSGAFALSPFLSGELAARAGARAVWLACLAAGGLVALGHLAVAGPRRRRLVDRARQAAAAEGGGVQQPAA
jgi:MFS family permease